MPDFQFLKKIMKMNSNEIKDELNIVQLNCIDVDLDGVLARKIPTPHYNGYSDIAKFRRGRLKWIKIIPH